MELPFLFPRRSSLVRSTLQLIDQAQHHIDALQGQGLVGRRQTSNSSQIVAPGLTIKRIEPSEVLLPSYQVTWQPPFSLVPGNLSLSAYAQHDRFPSRHQRQLAQEVAAKRQQLAQARMDRQGQALDRWKEVDARVQRLQWTAKALANQQVSHKLNMIMIGYNLLQQRIQTLNGLHGSDIDFWPPVLRKEVEGTYGNLARLMSLYEQERQQRQSAIEAMLPRPQRPLSNTIPQDPVLLSVTLGRPPLAWHRSQMVTPSQFRRLQRKADQLFQSPLSP